MTAFTGEIHPAAEVWPLLPEDELAELAASIDEIGLTDPITLDPAGRLLDGRNRLDACRLVDIEPTFATYNGDPVPFILAKNSDRRHMATGARAMATAVVLVNAGHRKNGRWQRGALANPEIGNNGKSWQNAMTDAGKVLDFAPSHAAAVIAGDEALAAAAATAKRLEADAATDVERMKRLKADNPKLAAQAANGDLTLAQAEAAHREQVDQDAKQFRLHVKRAQDCVDHWSTLCSLASGAFPDQSAVLDELNDTDRALIEEAITVIRKGTK